MRKIDCVTRDVPLPPGPSTLRIGLFLPGEGEPGDLVLALGFGQGRSWKEAPALGGLTLPPDCLPILLAVLLDLWLTSPDPPPLSRPLD